MAKQRRTPPFPSIEKGVNLDAVVHELDAVKRLLILLLAKLGSTSSEIAMALNLEQSTIRRWMRLSEVERLRLVKDDTSS